MPVENMNALVVFEQSEALLVEKARDFKGLRVKGLDDRAGLTRVHDSRMVLRGFRVSIEKDRVALKANALEFGRKVDAEAKRLTAIIEPTERDLEAEEQRVEAEKERIRAEAEAAKKKILDDRMAALASVAAHPAPSIVQGMSDTQFADALAEARKAFETAEAARIEAERESERERVQAERLAVEQRKSEQAEAARLAAIEAARLAEERRVQAEQHAAQEKALAEERKKFEAEQRALAETRRVEEERRAQHEREVAAERKRLDQERAAIEAEKATIEAAKPKPATKHCPTCTCHQGAAS